MNEEVLRVNEEESVECEELIEPIRKQFNLDFKASIIKTKSMLNKVRLWMKKVFEDIHHGTEGHRSESSGSNADEKRKESIINVWHLVIN